MPSTRAASSPTAWTTIARALRYLQFSLGSLDHSSVRAHISVLGRHQSGIHRKKAADSGQNRTFHRSLPARPRAHYRRLRALDFVLRDAEGHVPIASPVRDWHELPIDTTSASPARRASARRLRRVDATAGARCNLLRAKFGTHPPLWATLLFIPGEPKPLIVGYPTLHWLALMLLAGASVAICYDGRKHPASRVACCSAQAAYFCLVFCSSAAWTATATWRFIEATTRSCNGCTSASILRASRISRSSSGSVFGASPRCSWFRSASCRNPRIHAWFLDERRCSSTCSTSTARARRAAAWASRASSAWAPPSWAPLA